VQMTSQQVSSAVGSDPVLGPGTYTAGSYANGTVVVGPNGLLTVANGGSIITPNQAGAVVVNGNLFINTGSTLSLGPGSSFTLQTGASAIISNGFTTTLTNSTVTVSGVFQSFGELTISDSIINLAGGHFVNGFGSSLTVVNSVVTASGSGGFASQTGNVVALGALTSSPGLAGTAGIQPQLNVDGLLEWARTASAADLAGALG
ncbi:PPE family protein, partial [Mycobacterium rhizamassiliense]